MLELVHFGGTRSAALVESGDAPLRFEHTRRIDAVVDAATKGTLRALVVDARTPDDFFLVQYLLRALFDELQRPQSLFAPSRVLALIATGDVEAAFAFGRYGLAGVLEARSLAELPARVHRVLEGPTAPELLGSPVALAAPERTAYVSPRPVTASPAVILAYKHPPETLAVLERYCRVLREHATESTAFEDTATLLEVMVREGLTCQTNLAAKAGATHGGQFIGSFDFYRELRRTRYRHIPDDPSKRVPMEVFISVDEVLHDVLHVLFLANELRAGFAPQHNRVAEEFTVTWWQAVVHNLAFPDWLADRALLEINDDFIVNERNQVPREFWTHGHVFAPYAGYSWVRYVLARLPERASYLGQRPDLDALIESLRTRPGAAFLLPEASTRLAIPGTFDSYPTVPASLSVSAAPRTETAPAAQRV